MYFLCAANVLLKEFICLHSHGVLLLSIMFMASFALEHAAPSPSSFSACAKKYQRKGEKEREREKTTASNCIDQHQPLFLLFIFDFVRLCRWFFGSWKSFSLQCNTSKNKSICCYFTWNENESSGFSIKNLFDKKRIFRLGKCLCLRSWK